MFLCFERKEETLLNFQQAGFERGAKEYVHAARDEVNIAVVRSTEMSRPEMWERVDVLENQAEQPRTSHQVT